MAAPIDPEVYEDYKLALDDLRSISRPIINGLSMIAKENRHAAPTIARVIEERIHTCTAEHILPALYLMDSIVKNVGGEYTRLFSGNLLALVGGAYGRVTNLKTRQSVQRLVGTWRGVFDEYLVRTLEATVANPGVAMVPPQTHAPARAPMAPPVAAHAAAAPHTYGQPPYRGYGAMAPQRPPMPAVNAPPPPNFHQVQQLLALVNTQAMAATAPPPASMAAHLAPRAAITASRPRVAGTPYDRTRDVLTNDMLRQRFAGVVETLYSNLAIQCQQCGFRFSETDEGRKKMANHMDWHFRQNRKQQEVSKTSHSRDWFLSENSWVDTRDLETTSNQAPVFAEVSPTGGAQDDSDATGAAASLSTAITAIPLQEEYGRMCQICQEQLDVFYDQAEDEWMIRDAVVDGGEVFHVACHRDHHPNKRTNHANDDDDDDDDSALQAKRLRT